jgi:hypothetical protein
MHFCNKLIFRRLRIKSDEEKKEKKENQLIPIISGRENEFWA